MTLAAGTRIGVYEITKHRMRAHDMSGWYPCGMGYPAIVLLALFVGMGVTAQRAEGRASASDNPLPSRRRQTQDTVSAPSHRLPAGAPAAPGCGRPAPASALRPSAVRAAASHGPPCWRVSGWRATPQRGARAPRTRPRAPVSRRRSAHGRPGPSGSRARPGSGRVWRPPRASGPPAAAWPRDSASARRSRDWTAPAPPPSSSSCTAASLGRRRDREAGGALNPMQRGWA
jgi:hypothetical protein